MSLNSNFGATSPIRVVLARAEPISEAIATITPSHPARRLIGDLPSGDPMTSFIAMSVEPILRERQRPLFPIAAAMGGG